MIKLNWKKLDLLQKELIGKGLTDESQLIFIVIMNDGNTKKTVIKFKDMMKCFWTLSQSKFNIGTIGIQDSEGRLVYRHKRISYNEEIPTDGDGNMIMYWNQLNQAQKQTYLKILYAEISSHE